MEIGKRVLAYLIALAIMMSILFAGTYFVQYLSTSTEIDLDFLIAISDMIRMLGPVFGGYYLGRTLPARGIVNGLMVGVAAGALFEFGNPDWFFHEYWHQIVTSGITQLVVPAALAGGCGELHARRSMQV